MASKKRAAAHTETRPATRIKRNTTQASLDIPAKQVENQDQVTFFEPYNIIPKFWKRCNSSRTEKVTHDDTEYHVGDMVMVNVTDKLSGMRQEPAVIAECREPYILLVWLFQTKNTEERKKIVGMEVEPAYELILSVYSDFAPVSALARQLSPHERKQVCIDWVLDLEADKAVCIIEPRDGCFMRSLAEKVRARESNKGVATTRPLESRLPQQDANSPSMPEQREDREPAALVDRRTQSATSVKQPEASVSSSDRPDTFVEPSSSITAPKALQAAPSPEEGGSVNDDVLAGLYLSGTPSASYGFFASEGSNSQEDQRASSNQPHNDTALANSPTPEADDLHGPSLPAITVDEGIEPTDPQHRPDSLEERYNQTAGQVLSGLQDLRRNAESEVQQLPQHFRDGLITFLGSFGRSVPVFDPQYLWDPSQAENFSMPKSKQLLVTTLPVFRQLLLHDDHRMPKYVLIKDFQPSPAMATHWKKCLLEFLRDHPNTDFEIQDATDGEELTFDRKASEVYNRLSNEVPHNTILRHGMNSQDMIPWNLLNIHGGYMHTDGLPAIQGVWRFRCLATLCEQIEQPDLPSVGKYQGPALGGSAFSGCLNFALVGERGSYSKAHVDLLGSTGIEILFGRKAWFLLDGEMSDKEKSEFAEQGQEWQPSSARMKMVPLGPGDTLLMMPGHLSPHLVITVETCLSRGGMFWDQLTLPSTLQHLCWIFQHPGATNEHVNPEITSLIDVILRSRGPAAHEAQKLKDTMWPKFSCACKTYCGTKCRCSRENELRSVGCTNWCECNCENVGVTG